MQLPFPPTVNHYYGYNWKTHQKYISKRGWAYRKRLAEAVRLEHRYGKARLAILIDAHPPRLWGDLDNLLKPQLDALEHAGVFDNDSQVDDLRIRRGHPVPGGRADVHIWDMGQHYV